MKKPAIPATPTATTEWVRNVRDALEIIMGRRSVRIKLVREVKLTAAAGPTKAEYDALATQLVVTQKKVNELVDLLHGE